MSAKDAEEALVTVLLGGCAFLGLLIVVSLLGVWWSYCFSYVWGWFIVPVFKLPHLTLAQAYGLSLIASFFKKTDSEKVKWINLIVAGILGPAVLLGIGYLLKGYL